MKKCQKFTPNQYVKDLLSIADYSGKKILKKTFLENSCGDGNILVPAVEKYIKTGLKAKLSKSEIAHDLETFFIAYEIDLEVIKLCKNKLNDLVTFYNLPNINWDIRNTDYLKDKLDKKVDYIVGNPPYIMYQELDKKNRDFLRQNFDVCEQGKFDYCYAFIEKSITDLNESGKMSYFVPNSIFKNVFGQKLRDYMKESLTKIVDFQHSVVFSDALTSPAIIGLKGNSKNEYIVYIDSDQSKKIKIRKDYLIGKWVFTEDYQEIVDNRTQYHARFGDYFDVSNSVATLLNKAFIIKNGSEEKKQPIEADVLFEAASPRGKGRNAEEYILFPYKFSAENIIVRYSEEEFTVKFPNATKHLLELKKELLERKADGEWFEFGRSQALNKIKQKKLLMSSVITDKVKVYEIDEEVIPYSGFFVTSREGQPLKIAKAILESSSFYDYIMKTAINANGKSVRCSVKEIMSYPLDERFSQQMQL